MTTVAGILSDYTGQGGNQVMIGPFSRSTIHESRIPIQHPRQALLLPCSIRSGLESTFPDRDDAPAEVAEGCLVSQVTRLVPHDLRLPEVGPGFRMTEGGTFIMTVPEATVDDDESVDGR
jgi:hypothetical protein